jgi:hypothetical protein
MSKSPGLSGPDCCYCGRAIGINQDARVVKGYGTYVGWRHPACLGVKNKAHWEQKVAEAKEFVEILRSGNRGKLHPALRW